MNRPTHCKLAYAIFDARRTFLSQADCVITYSGECETRTQITRSQFSEYVLNMLMEVRNQFVTTKEAVKVSKMGRLLSRVFFLLFFVFWDN